MIFLAYGEEDYILISALAQHTYCPRRCWLMHAEGEFTDNVFTMRGRLLHEHVHQQDDEMRDGVHIERSLDLWNDRLGLIGKADVVEFHDETPYPVEYKHGPRRRWGHAEIQVCAQAMCLEEMLGRPAPRGAIYFHGSRRRTEVVFDESLRAQVVATVQAVRAMLAAGKMPPPANDARCRHCSLQDSCLPEVTGEPERVQALHEALFDLPEE